MMKANKPNDIHISFEDLNLSLKSFVVEPIDLKESLPKLPPLEICQFADILLNVPSAQIWLITASLASPAWL